MLTYMLFVALTNLAMGIVLGYFYGPLFWPQIQAADAADKIPHAPGHPRASDHAPSDAGAAPPGALNTAVVTPPDTNAAAPGKAPDDGVSASGEEIRPLKPTGSREVTALDLADVMSELGVEPASAEAVAP